MLTRVIPPPPSKGCLKRAGMTASMKAAKTLQVLGFDWEVSSPPVKSSSKTVTFEDCGEENEPNARNITKLEADEMDDTEVDNAIEVVSSSMQEIFITPSSRSMPDISSTGIKSKGMNWSMPDLSSRIQTKCKGINLAEPRALAKKRIRAERPQAAGHEYQSVMKQDDEEDEFDSAYESYFGLSMKL
jgi:hypothetical protein